MATTHQPEIIQAIIRERVGDWKPAPFSWPHDSFMNEPWGYAIHEASVGAWNKEDRQTECAKFLLEWATVENITNAISESKYPIEVPFYDDGEDGDDEVRQELEETK